MAVATKPTTETLTMWVEHESDTAAGKTMTSTSGEHAIIVSHAATGRSKIVTMGPLGKWARKTTVREYQLTLQRI